MDKRMTEWDSWLSDDRLDPDLRRELEDLAARGETGELALRFSGDLQFGTGGLRERIGAGTRRMNVHTVRKAVYGVLRWLEGVGGQGVVVAYDGRRRSREFAEATAAVAAARGVQAYLFSRPAPTPILSFAVRHLHSGAGIMITASHNPPEYNGFKVYGPDGGQLLPDDAGRITEAMDGLSDLFSVPSADFSAAVLDGRIRMVGDEVEDAYFAQLHPVYGQVDMASKSALRMLYTPLHGVGGPAVQRAFAESGFGQVRVVPGQAPLDVEFTHAPNPNPEEPAAYEMALSLADEWEADLILATDPDADRLGVMARNARGEFEFLSGNEVGALLIEDLVEVLKAKGGIPENSVVVTTIVTSDLGEAVARSYGIGVERTLTGFKYIGAKIREYEQSGLHTFLFGYEESVGYLALPFVRDKDGVQAAVLVANMAARHKREGRDLPSARDRLFGRFGYFQDRLLGFAFDGLDGGERMSALMEGLRREPLQPDGLPLEAWEDYLRRKSVRVADGSESPLSLPVSDVLKFRFAGGSWAAVRPSGTEPKLKVYIGSRAASADGAGEWAQAIEAALRARVGSY